MADWYYAQGTVQRGPVSIAFITDSLRSGVLKSDDLVWREGLPGWSAAGQLPELAGVFRAASPPPLPAQSQPQATYRYVMPAAPSPAAVQTFHPGIRSSYSSLAVASMVLGLVAFVLLPFGPLLGVPALVCGSIALRGMRRTGMRENWGMAFAGVLLGVFWTLIGGLVLGAILLFVANQSASWDLCSPSSPAATPIMPLRPSYTLPSSP